MDLNGYCSFTDRHVADSICEISPRFKLVLGTGKFPMFAKDQLEALDVKPGNQTTDHIRGPEKQ